MASTTFHSTAPSSIAGETLEDGDTTFPSLGEIIRAHKERIQTIVRSEPLSSPNNGIPGRSNANRRSSESGTTVVNGSQSLTVGTITEHKHTLDPHSIPQFMLPPIIQNSSGFHCQKYESQVVDESISEPEVCSTRNSSISRSTAYDSLQEQSSGYQSTSFSPRSRDMPRTSAHSRAKDQVPAAGFRKLHMRQQAENRRQIRRNLHLSEPCLSLSDSSSDEDGLAPTTTNVVIPHPPPPPINQTNNEYYVDYLLQRRARCRRGGKRKIVSYLVKWRGYGPEHNSWVLKKNIDPELVQAFDLKSCHV